MTIDPSDPSGFTITPKPPRDSEIAVLKIFNALRFVADGCDSRSSVQRRIEDRIRTLVDDLEEEVGS